MIKKRIFILIILLITICKTTFTEVKGGFEAIVNVPIGVGITIIHKNIELKGNPKGNVNFQVGIEANLGYMFQIKERMGISLLAVIGYSYTETKYSKFNNTVRYKFIDNDFYFGIMPKFNFYSCSIGLNIGYKITLTPNSIYYTAEIGNIEIKHDTYARLYIRGTFDYSFVVGIDSAINLGFYIGYDFGNYWAQTSEYLNVVKDETFGNIDIGLQLGYRYGPKF
ncbi:hypothetical protein [Brachyspira murdochii]|uniref:hypothetical protein n=1 Tax=Brachyspira murdochii TaxID=84378 RepID=UPI003003CE22